MNNCKRCYELHGARELARLNRDAVTAAYIDGQIAAHLETHGKPDKQQQAREALESGNTYAVEAGERWNN